MALFFNPLRRHSLRATVALLACLATGGAMAQTATVKVLVGFPPGGKPTSTLTAAVCAIAPPVARQASKATVARIDWRRRALKKKAIEKLLKSSNTED